MSKKEQIEVYEIFKTEFGEENAMTIMEYLENRTSNSMQKPVETKSQIVAIKEDIDQFGQDFTNLLENQSANLKKWMFALWVATVVFGVIIILV